MGKNRGKKRGKEYFSKLPPKSAAIVLLNEKGKKVKEDGRRDGGRECVILAEIRHLDSGLLCLVRSEKPSREARARERRYRRGVDVGFKLAANPFLL